MGCAKIILDRNSPMWKSAFSRIRQGYCHKGRDKEEDQSPEYSDVLSSNKWRCSKLISTLCEDVLRPSLLEDRRRVHPCEN